MSARTRLSALPRLGLRGLRTKARAVPAAVPATPEVEAHARKMRTIESMPFQTYQHALAVIRKDHDEKLVQIKEEHEKIAKMIKYKNLSPTSRVVKSMTRYLEGLKVKADINNPRVKYNFDTGVIGMNKPVYRFLLEKKWRSMRRPVLMQRLTQMHVIPDVLPDVDPRVDVQVRFAGRDTAPGVFVESKTSERPPTLKIIPFRQGEKLCTIAVVDPDVPDLEKDGFRYRCHWIVSNIPISPTQTQAIGTGAKPSDTLLPYLPPHVQKGSPYHRYALFVFEQPDNKRLGPELLAGKIDRETFNLRSFQKKHELKTVGAYMWRGRWDDGTKDVMERNGLPGWDVMFTRVKDT
ncbi:phosphatidylethanolamine-binding protein [Morchella snyderi]|nr:phosphatidylethanolamine-binding protein [Morchella snyderi]